MCALNVAAASVKLGIHKRPYCKINVEGSNCTFLFDSGAQVTLMSEREFRKIPVHKRPQQLKTAMRISGVTSDSKVQIKGLYPIRLSVNGRSATVPVFVAKNMTQKNILGIDAIKTLGLGYNSKTDKVILLGPNDFETNAVCSVNNVTLDPFQVMNINVKTPPGWEECRKAVFKCRSPDHPLLYSPEGMVDPSQGHFSVKIKNCSPLQISISKNEKIGLIENVSYVQMAEVDGVNLMKKMKVMTVEEEITIPNVPPMAEAERKDFLSRMNLTVPQKKGRPTWI